VIHLAINSIDLTSRSGAGTAELAAPFSTTITAVLPARDLVSLREVVQIE
jgi:hypothetical protein